MYSKRTLAILYTVKEKKSRKIKKIVANIKNCGIVYIRQTQMFAERGQCERIFRNVQKR